MPASSSSTWIRGSFFLGAMVWSGAAAAQATTPSGTAPTTASEPEVAPTPTAPAATPQPGEPAARPPAQPSDEELANKTRFRFAIHLLGGPWLVPDRTGGGGGLGVQLGAQINDLLGVYYSGTGAVGVAGSNDAGGVGSSAGAWVYNSVMADVTLARILQIGVGPSIDSLAFGSADVKAAPAGASAKAVALSGTFIGLQTRVGIALGQKKPGKAGRFMLGLEVHPTFAEVVPISTFITIGGGSF